MKKNRDVGVTISLGFMAVCILLVMAYYLNIWEPGALPFQETSSTTTTTLNINQYTPRVCFENNKCVYVEIADDEVERVRGLMYRDSLPDGRGMLFVFPFAQSKSFWMKNTKIPLDMIWIDGEHTIVGITEGATPCTSDPCDLYTSPAPVTYVLEVPGWWTKDNKIGVGERLEFHHINT